MARRRHPRTPRSDHAHATVIIVLAVLATAGLVVVVTGSTDGFPQLSALVVAVVGILASINRASAPDDDERPRAIPPPDPVDDDPTDGDRE